jgi:hypothetical protein
MLVSEHVEVAPPLQPEFVRDPFDIPAFLDRRANKHLEAA